MKCPYCNKEIDLDSKFCEYCGAQIGVIETKPQSTSSKKNKVWILWLLIIVLLVSTGVLGYLYVMTDDDLSYFIRLYKKEKDKRIEQLESLGYIDLGLPSGTLWKNANEGGDKVRYTYDKAVNKFGKQLPTTEQLEELDNKCKWEWTTQNRINGYKITGPNGNSIFLPAAGIRYCDGSVAGVGTSGNYWSPTPYDSDLAWYLYFSSSEVDLGLSDCCFGQSVRLVLD